MAINGKFPNNLLRYVAQVCDRVQELSAFHVCMSVSKQIMEESSKC